MEQRTEIFYDADSVSYEFECYRTIHGPVLDSIWTPFKGGLAISQKMTFWKQEQGTMEGVLNLQECKNIDDFEENISKFVSSHNWFWIDNLGNTGYYHVGSYPIRPQNGLLHRKIDDRFSYHDYLNWPIDMRSEIINGVIYDMTPAPSKEHQIITRELLGRFWSYLRNKSCEVFQAPFDVLLPDKPGDIADTETVVQPDISIICDKMKLNEKGCIGAPDLIIEITSPSTASKDMKEKFDLYERHGVKEYWIVHPEQKIVTIFKIGKNKKYGRPDNYSEKDKIEVGLLKGLIINLKDIFKN